MSSAEKGSNQLSEPGERLVSLPSFSLKQIDVNHFEVRSDVFVCFNPILKPTGAFSS